MAKRKHQHRDLWVTLAVALIPAGPGLSIAIWAVEHGTRHIGCWPHTGEIAGCVMMALGIVLAVAVVRGWWLPGGFDEEKPKSAQGSGQAAHELPARPSVSYEGITLELVDDNKWDLGRGKALIADVQVRVTNNTMPGRVITLMRPDLESDPGPMWAERPRLAPEEVKALFDEILSRSPLNPHMDLKPGESRVIRVVRDAFLPYPAGEGRPYCEFVVTNAEGTTYALPIPALGSPGGGHVPALMRLRNLAMEGRLLREQIQSREADAGVPMADPGEAQRYQYWMTRVARALRPWPELQAQFQASRTAVTDRDPAWVAQRMELLEEMLRALEGRPRQDAERMRSPSARDPADTPHQPSTLPQVRRLLDEGRSLQGELDRAPPPTVPPGLPDRAEGWEMKVRAGLESRPDLCARFEAAQFVIAQSAPENLSNRLKAHLGVLEAIEQELTEAGD